MTVIEQIVFAIAVVAFVGVGIYTVGSGYFILSAIGGPRRTRSELLSLIPLRLRRFGYWSMGVFFGCLALLSVVTLIRRAS
jgi:hypothetical protein